MIKRRTTAVALALLLSACASGPPPEPPPPPPLDPTGVFDFTAEVDGMAVNGVLTIRGSAEEGYRGSLDSDMGPASVSRIAIDGQTMTFYIPDADVGVEVVFAGTEFNGSISGAMGAGNFYGTKREGS
jgi:hypothetical protein